MQRIIHHWEMTDGGRLVNITSDYQGMESSCCWQGHQCMALAKSIISMDLILNGRPKLQRFVQSAHVA
jgi:hypothetical protein